MHRIITDYDATGWRRTEGELDRYGREIPDAEYHTRDFERLVALRARTQAIARHQTIVFCVNQEHALEMRRALVELNTDLVRKHPDYVCRVTADEGDVGSSHRSRFRDVETTTPVILTTSHLLATGVDAPTCKNVVLVRAVGSMPEFKQIIGRGTRLRPDYGKLAFNIVDYTGTATEGDREVRRSRVRRRTDVGARDNDRRRGRAEDVTVIMPRIAGTVHYIEAAEVALAMRQRPSRSQAS